MHLPVTVVLSLLSFLPGTLAGPDQSITKFSYCYTASGTKSVKPVPTVSKSSVKTWQIVKKTTIYPTKTVTPKPCTKNTRTTSTSVITKTAPQVTDLYTSTRTNEVVVTESTTTTITTVIEEVQTTTVYPSGETTTVPASPGFTPAAQGPIAARGLQIRGQSFPENALEPRGNLKPTRCEFHNGKPTFYPTKLYPTAVTCTKSVKVLHTQTKTATARRTITKYLRPSTVTKTQTIVRTTTTTIFPTHVTSTVIVDTSTTRSTTLTETSTSSQTVTNTVTIEAAPTATRYAVCDRIASDNVVFTDVAGTDGSFFSLGPGSEVSAYECCAACARNSECRATAFIASIGYCQGVRFPGGCNGAQVVVDAGRGTGGGIGVSASNCGGVGRRA